MIFNTCSLSRFMTLIINAAASSLIPLEIFIVPVFIHYSRLTVSFLIKYIVLRYEWELHQRLEQLYIYFVGGFFIFLSLLYGEHVIILVIQILLVDLFSYFLFTVVIFCFRVIFLSIFLITIGLNF